MLPCGHIASPCPFKVQCHTAETSGVQRGNDSPGMAGKQRVNKDYTVAYFHSSAEFMMSEQDKRQAGGQ